MAVYVVVFLHAYRHENYFARQFGLLVLDPETFSGFAESGQQCADGRLGLDFDHLRDLFVSAVQKKLHYAAPLLEQATQSAIGLLYKVGVSTSECSLIVVIIASQNCCNRNCPGNNGEVAGDLDIGARIRDIRDRIGMEARELGELVDLHPSVISNIEHGKRSVKSDELARIAKALGVSPLAILEEGSLLWRLPVAPRSASGTVLRGEVLDRLTGLTELHEVLAEWEPPIEAHEFPSVDTTEWLKAARLVSKWASGELGELPPGDERFVALVKKIEEKFRVDVLVEERSTDSVAGASVTDPEFSLIFINATQPVTRALFSLGHELGHVLVQDGEFIVDEDLVAHSDSERFANAFAAELLLPEDGVRSRTGDNPDARALCEVLDFYGTSYETLVYRLHNLQIVNAAGRDKLKNLGLRGLVSQIDDQALASRLLSRLGKRPSRHAPAILAERAFKGYREGVISARPLASLLGLPAEIVAAGMELDAAATLDEAVSKSGLDDVDFDPYGGSPVD
jgi:Zn-dependent peptidase ImmA (M78 family)